MQARQVLGLYGDCFRVGAAGRFADSRLCVFADYRSWANRAGLFPVQIGGGGYFEDYGF